MVRRATFFRSRNGDSVAFCVFGVTTLCLIGFGIGFGVTQGSPKGHPSVTQGPPKRHPCVELNKCFVCNIPRKKAGWGQRSSKLRVAGEGACAPRSLTNRRGDKRKSSLWDQSVRLFATLGGFI